MHLDGFKESLQADKRRYLVNKSLPSYMGGSKKIVPDNVLFSARTIIQVFLGS